MSNSIKLTDALLEAALARRATHAPSQLLLDRIVTEAAGLPQEGRAPRWGVGLPMRPGSRLHPSALTSAVVAVVAIAVIVTVLRPSIGPGDTPTPGPSATPALPAETPEARLLGDYAAQRLRLGFNVAPIDVVGAFGSMWIANAQANDVRRFDPVTLEEQARIDVMGAAWFAVADDALWVTSQVGTGLTRIDPRTSAAVAHAGAAAPCGAPVPVLLSIWYSACDANAFLRIDLSTNTVEDRIPAQGHDFLVHARGELLTMSPNGLALLDTGTRSFTPIGERHAGAILLGSDGETAWLRTDSAVFRIDPADGRTVASFAYRDAVAVTFEGDHAWLTVPLVGVVEIDLATNAVRRTIPLGPTLDVAREAFGALWVTDFNNSALWRVEP